MIFTYLEEVKQFLEQEVCPGIRLKRSNPDNVTSFSLVPPTVTVGWPPQATSRDQRSYVPGIAIGVAGDIVDTGKERILPVELAVIVGTSATVCPDGSLFFDNSGFQDLLELMDKITTAIRNTNTIGGVLTLAETAIRWRPQNDPVGDCWLGSIEIKLLAAPIPVCSEQELL